MSKQSELEALQKKIDKFLALNNELWKAGLIDVTHDKGSKGYLQADFDRLMDTAEKFGIKPDVKQWGGDTSGYWKWEIETNELKMFAIVSDEAMVRRGLLEQV